ncbi:DUF4199 domain-containing protein [Phenylobacterium sp.]|uniref:DUF4199 domain-containing protein n=1 Tax=Phenylobacterium sp. TaxID=1871053 RepID=UPI002732AB3D|nr:DUF4199 domain-containing protein [Phenylobacterium sp.]MDP3853878.1 DUF4199 domain-containing protein [Phenylobacterium sp.]
MTRIILTYGLISGLVVILGVIGSIASTGGEGPHSSVLVGYLIMLVALCAILVGVKQYRDQTLGGVIGFGRALVLGLGIAAIASLAYIAVWEAYLALTDYVFMDQYTAKVLADKRAAGVSGADYAKAAAEMETMRVLYANPLIRMAMTFTEIFPVGLLISLVSAALLRNPRFLPARSRPVAAA